MKVKGDAILHTDRETAWKAFHDPQVLGATIPGIQTLTQTGDNAYTMTVTAGVAAIKGTYEGNVALTDVTENERLTLDASGSGGPGTIQLQVDVQLQDDPEGTKVFYDADAIVGGMIGGVAQRMLTGVGKKLAAEFFKAIDKEIARQAAGGAPKAPPVQQSGAAEAAPSGEAAAVPAGVPATPVYSAAPGAGVLGDSSMLTGAGIGAALVLVGVLAGGLIGRRK